MFKIILDCSKTFVNCENQRCLEVKITASHAFYWFLEVDKNNKLIIFALNIERVQAFKGKKHLGRNVLIEALKSNAV